MPEQVFKVLVPMACQVCGKTRGHELPPLFLESRTCLVVLPCRGCHMVTMHQLVKPERVR